MSEWVLSLSDSIDDGVALVLSHSGGLGEHGDLLHRLDD